MIAEVRPSSELPCSPMIANLRAVVVRNTFIQYWNEHLMPEACDSITLPQRLKNILQDV